MLPFTLPYLKKEGPVLRANIKFLILGAVLGITIPNILIYHAARYSQVMNLSIVSLSSPLFVIILARIFYNEYLSLLRILGLSITIGGILLLLSKGDLHILLNLHFEKGDLIMFGNTLSFAVYTLLIRKMPKGISGMSFMLNIFLLGGFFTLPVTLWEVCTDGFVVFSVSLVAWFIYVSLFSSILGYACWNLGVAYIGSAKTSIIYYLLPVICGIEGALFLDEPVFAIHIISMALIIAGTVLAINAKKPAAK
jgi:drug/metabolite transporter (DMT)-like permease